MPALALGDYVPALFDSLPSIDAAGMAFDKINGFASIEEELAALAKKHAALAEQFGIQLLHRHSRLDDDEVMISYRGTSVPVKLGDLAPGVEQLIHPVCWGLRPGQCGFVPLEFALSDGIASNAPSALSLNEELAKDLARILKEHALDAMFGLALLQSDGIPGLESTQGRANIVLPAHLFVQPAESIETLWPIAAFAHPRQAGQKRCYGICVTAGRVHIADHMKTK